MYCGKCGVEIDGSAKFCANCGVAINSEVPENKEENAKSNDAIKCPKCGSFNVQASAQKVSNPMIVAMALLLGGLGCIFVGVIGAVLGGILGVIIGAIIRAFMPSRYETVVVCKSCGKISKVK